MAGNYLKWLKMILVSQNQWFFQRIGNIDSKSIAEKISNKLEITHLMTYCVQIILMFNGWIQT